MCVCVFLFDYLSHILCTAVHAYKYQIKLLFIILCIKIWWQAGICLTPSVLHNFSWQPLGIWQCQWVLGCEGGWWLGGKHMCLSLSGLCQHSVIPSFHRCTMACSEVLSAAPVPTAIDKFSSWRHVDWQRPLNATVILSFAKGWFCWKVQNSNKGPNVRLLASWKPSSSLCWIWVSECLNMFMRVTHAGAAPELPSSIVPASGWLAWLPP